MTPFFCDEVKRALAQSHYIEVAQGGVSSHGLRTPNEGINQRYLKNLTDVADKICFGRT
jgi:hypothetical protein